MKTVSLSGSPRASMRKNAAALGANGQVPCVLYGGGEQIHFSADIRHFKNIIYNADTNLVDITVDGKTYRSEYCRRHNFTRITDNLYSLLIFSGWKINR